MIKHRLFSGIWSNIWTVKIGVDIKINIYIKGQGWFKICVTAILSYSIKYSSKYSISIKKKRKMCR